jgi:hypothetical protein
MYRKSSVTDQEEDSEKTDPEHMHQSEGNAFEIVYPNGVKLRIPAGVKPVSPRWQVQHI